ncbi:MAG: type IV toxin-antitoxin system AbiEi family antitoxin domain-containing protein [Chloroflexi bacterium]|jgi:predicted transcriptional regulator of viral defense system|nr:type IV toxin-antitoxin system AbiEi family antitoxin domain-containing protein [Chloroflexota bacterium]
MAKQLSWPLVERNLRDAGLSLFTPQDLANLLGGSVISLRFLVTRAVKRGDILKLRRGLYALTSPPPGDLQLANALYRPSYVSFGFALSYYHLIPEAAYAVTSATPRATSSFNALGKRFVYHHLRPRVFTGFRAERVQNQTVWIAEPEKALVDVLYFALLGKLGRPERLDTSGLSERKMQAFARLFGRKDLMEAIRQL